MTINCIRFLTFVEEEEGLEETANACFPWYPELFPTTNIPTPNFPKQIFRHQIFRNKFSGTKFSETDFPTPHIPTTTFSDGQIFRRTNFRTDTFSEKLIYTFTIDTCNALYLS